MFDVKKNNKKNACFKCSKLLWEHTHDTCAKYAIIQSKLSKRLIVFILMTDDDYSQEVNKMNEHDISIDHSLIT